MKAFAFLCASTEAKSAVVWAQDYRLGNRNPIPTKNESLANTQCLPGDYTVVGSTDARRA